MIADADSSIEKANRVSIRLQDEFAILWRR